MAYFENQAERKESKRNRVRFVLDVVSTALILVAISIWAGQRFMPEIEGRIWPVTSPAVLSNPRPYVPPEYQFRWDAESEKFRDCQFLRLDWFLGPRGGRVTQVVSGFLDQPMVRGVGFLEWDGLVIALDQNQVLENSHANAVHKCPGRWWETVTPFYDPAVIVPPATYSHTP